MAVFLEDSDQHPRVRQRIELTASLIEPEAAGTLRLESQGVNRVERVLSLVLLGDLVSIYLAVLRGIDPTPVPMIERLKDGAGRESRLSGLPRPTRLLYFGAARHRAPHGRRRTSLRDRPGRSR